MNSRQFIHVVAAIACMSAIEASSAAVFDATSDFSATTNPSGVWSYGYDPATQSGYQFKPFDSLQHLGISPIWQDSTYISLNVPAIYKNTSQSTLNGVNPGQLALHPGPAANDDAAILRFTSPANGFYAIQAQFFSGDQGVTDAWIVKDGVLASPLSFLGSTDADPIYESSGLYLGAGSTIDFVVGNHGDYHFDSTPISVQISAVPELASSSMVLAGLLVIYAISKRKMASGRTSPSMA